MQAWTAKRAALAVGLSAIGIALACASGCGSAASDLDLFAPPLDASTADGAAPTFTIEGDAGAAPSFGPFSDAGAADAAFDAGCVSPASACAGGKCGPVKDPCTGVVTECGGCAPLTLGDGGAAPQVCDLTTHTCGAPKLTCGEIGAECGTVKNSCGTYLDCPACADGQECDPDSHKCTTCTQVTCQDLGYECGDGWNGCGDPTNAANAISCGTCAGNAAKPRCNPVFHVCEASCSPPTTAAQKKALCDAAKAARQVECGIVSDGCGGTINCDTVPGYGCPVGQSCGVRGIANRCDAYEPPTECVAAGRNCNPTDPSKQLKSACTGQALDCGTCPAPQVCNDNGVCGAPCQPKTCADIGDPECAQNVDDGCGGKLTCGSCPGGVCTSNQTCCTYKTCDKDYPGQCGVGLDDGCGGHTLNCGPCVNGSTPSTATQACTATESGGPTTTSGHVGTCCTKKTCAHDYAGQCGSHLADGCGGTIDCSCGTGQTCTTNGGDSSAPASGVAGACCTYNSCPSNSCTSIPNNCGSGNISCNTCDTGTTCGTNNSCCAAATCTISTSAGNKTRCDVPSVNNGCTTATCACGNGQVCYSPSSGPDVGKSYCCTKKTCASYGSNACGTDLSDGCGGKLQCPCTGVMDCVKNGGTPPAGTAGTCACPTGTPYTCGNLPSPNTGKCGTFNDGCGATVSCGCPGGEVCDNGACCTPLVCPAPALGSACFSAHANGCGGTYSCGCPSGAGNENFTCAGGTCQCVKDTCRGRTGPQPDRCGGLIQCGG